MSELKFSCPHCSQHIACGPEWAGMQTKCPSCQNDIVIPKPPPAVAAPPQPPPAVAAPPQPPKPHATPLRVSAPGAHGGASHSAPPPPPPPPPPARSSTGGSSLSVARPAAPAPAQHEPVAAGAHAGGGAPPGGPSVYPGDNPAMQWAGLVGAFIVTGVIIAMAVAWKPPQNTPYMLAMKAKEAAERGAATPDEDEEGNSGGLTNTPAAAAATPQWGLSLQTAQIPQDAASGNFDGRPFTVDRAYVQRTPAAYLLTLRQGSAARAEREILIMLPHAGQTLDGQSWNVPPDATGAPRVIKRWLENARQQTKIFTNGYAMKLEFEQTANNQIPARLFVSLPDDGKTFVAGTVTASFLVAAPAGQQQRRQ